MINSKKKGFTIVELVIVIAVVAILASVLIPTFSSLVRKANIANDTAVAKNMNTALATYSAENGNPDSFEEVLIAIEEAGYVLANLNAKAEGNLYAWDEKNNQIVYISKEGKVIYQNEDFANENLQFVIANSDVVLPNWANTENVVDMTKPTSATFLKNALSEGGNIVLGNNIAVTNGNANGKNIINGTVNLELGNNIINLDLPNAVVETANWAGLWIQGGDIVINGENGGITTANNEWLNAINIVNDSALKTPLNVTINGGYYTAGCEAVYIKSGYTTVTITGGTFESHRYKDYVLNIYEDYGSECADEAARSQFIIKGGTFVNFNPADSICGNNEVIVADGYTVKSETQSNGDIWYTVVEE